LIAFALKKIDQAIDFGDKYNIHVNLNFQARAVRLRRKNWKNGLISTAARFIGISTPQLVNLKTKRIKYGEKNKMGGKVAAQFDTQII
jgi:hypothetical protein